MVYNMIKHTEIGVIMKSTQIYASFVGFLYQSLGQTKLQNMVSELRRNYFQKELSDLLKNYLHQIFQHPTKCTTS